jgi:ParB family chromosome partitioning protein
VPSTVRHRPSLADFELAAAAVPPVDDRLVHSLPIASIQPNPRNPHQHLDGIDELAESLRAHGLLRPVVVRRRGTGYELVAGHRRLEAAKQAGWTDIPALVREETDDHAYILTLVENPPARGPEAEGRGSSP